MPDNSYMDKMRRYPKRNLVWGRKIPTQGNISVEDMLDYLPDNYQDMERPTSPVAGDILKRYGPDVQRRNMPPGKANVATGGKWQQLTDAQRAVINANAPKNAPVGQQQMTMQPAHRGDINSQYQGLNPLMRSYMELMQYIMNRRNR